MQVRKLRAQRLAWRCKARYQQLKSIDGFGSDDDGCCCNDLIGSMLVTRLPKIKRNRLCEPGCHITKAGNSKSVNSLKKLPVEAIGAMKL